MTIAIGLPAQVVFGGIVDGLSIGLLALGIVLVYRSSRVINFAVGNIGVLAASVLALLVVHYRWPYWPALLVALAAGAAFATAMEATVITRLFRAPRVILLVATIGIAQLAEAARLALPETTSDLTVRYPIALSGDWEVLGIRVTGAELLVLVVVPLVALLLTWFLERTDLGTAVRAAAADPERARLSAINPKLLSTLVWTIAGLLSGLSLILLAGTSGTVSALGSLGPNTLVRVLAAALLGGLVSFPRALLGGLAIGVGEALIRYHWPTQIGLVDALLFLVVLAAVWWSSRAGRRDDDAASFSFAPRVRPVPERLRGIWWVRGLPVMAGAVALAVAVVLPLLVTQPSRQFLYARILLVALVALSLVVLTGWAGQVSLGQAAFAGLGALGTAALVRGARIGVGVGEARIDVEIPQVDFVVAVLVMAACCAVVAVVIGAGALRVSGLLLAVVTLAFALAAQQYLWRRPFLAGDGFGAVTLPRATVGPFDLADQRTYYYLALGVLALAMVVVARLRRSGIGRATIAVRDNADAAAACTVSPARVKLGAFAVAGGIAGVAGGLLGGLLSTISASEVFGVAASLEVVSVAVIGGVGSVSGPVLGALWVVGLPAFWPDNTIVPVLTSSIGLLALLMYFPGGLVQIGYSARDAFLAWLDGRLPETETAPKAAAIPARTRARSGPAAPAATGVALATRGMTVRFGARVAVDDVSLTVPAGEVVGLIGANGAGKSTLMNAIGGFVPAAGDVELLGRDVTRASPARRARAGLGRTFQAARLFPDLSVRETIQLALEARHRTAFVPVALLLPRGFARERAQRSDAEEIIHFLGLGRYADTLVAELSTGTRRIVELADLLAVDARVLCLDEPTAGVAQRETEAFAPLLLRIRAELDATLLVIEHDMPMVMGISDRLVCLEAGRVIAAGSPAEIRSDPRVIASYLGTDERAIRRSGATATLDPDGASAG